MIGIGGLNFAARWRRRGDSGSVGRMARRDLVIGLVFVAIGVVTLVIGLAVLALSGS